MAYHMVPKTSPGIIPDCRTNDDSKAKGKKNGGSGKKERRDGWRREREDKENRQVKKK